MSKETGGKARSKSTLERIPSQIKVARILSAITERPQTGRELAERLFISYVHFRTIIKIMHEQKLVHISKWSRKEVAGLMSRPRPIWSAGAGKDAKKPPPLTKAVSCKRNYAKIKADPERYARYLATSRKRQMRIHFKPRPDVAAAWITPRISA